MTQKDVQSLIKSFSPKEFLLFSNKLQEMLDDLEDTYWVEQNKGKIDRNDYIDAEILDSYGEKLNENIGMKKVSQTI